MQQITIEEAQRHLADIIARLQPGAEVLIVHDSKPVATIRSTELLPRSAERKLGTLKNSVTFVAPDFDSIPEGFEDLIG
jgi:antitoxin (DNA-binding transcriptional repressor) of toxin-antitoxin stability system